METEKKLEQQGLTLVEQAHEIKITTDAQYESASEFLLSTKALQTQIKGHHADMKQKAHATWKEIVAREKGLLEPVAAAEGVVKGLMQKFLRAREERQRKVLAAREEKAVEVERERREIEEAAAKKGEEPPPPPPVKAAKKLKARPKPAGVVVRKVWKFEVVDVEEMNPAFMVPDRSAIRQAVETLGVGAAAAVGGIRVWQEDSIGARG